MADRQPIPGGPAANPEFRGSVRAEDGGEVFVYNGGLDFDETGEFVVSRGPNVVLEVIDASAMSARDRPASSEAVIFRDCVSGSLLIRRSARCTCTPQSSRRTTPLDGWFAPAGLRASARPLRRRYGHALSPAADPGRKRPVRPARRLGSASLWLRPATSSRLRREFADTPPASATSATSWAR